MKKLFLGLLAIAVVVLLILVFRGGEETPSSSSRSSDSERTEPNKRSEAESLLGISLPSDAVVPTLLNNTIAVSVLGETRLSLSDARAFFTSEMSRTGYSVSRNWGVLPTDNTTRQSASFTGKGETWAINLHTEGSLTLFDIQRQK